MSEYLKAPPDMIILRPDGTTQEVYFKSTAPKQNDYNPQLNLYKKFTQPKGNKK